MNTEKPEPPEGYETRRGGDITTELPEDAYIWDGTKWRTVGHIIPLTGHFYATRTPIREKPPESPEKDADTEYDRLKAQKDAIIGRANEKLRDEGRKSVILLRCTECLTVPQQNSNEFTGGECGGCIAKERDSLRAQLTAQTAIIGKLEASLEMIVGIKPSDESFAWDRTMHRIAESALTRAKENQP